MNSRPIFIQNGEIKSISDTRQVNKNLTKRHLILNRDKRGEKDKIEPVMFEAINNECKLMDGFKEGDKVEVHFWISGREVKHEKTMYFNTLRIVDIKLNSKR